MNDEHGLASGRGILTSEITNSDALERNNNVLSGIILLSLLAPERQANREARLIDQSQLSLGDLDAQLVESHRMQKFA